MYSEEAEFNTKTMYVCSFDIRLCLFMLLLGIQDVLISQFSQLTSKLYLKKSSVWSIMSPVYLTMSYVHLIPQCMLLTLHNRDSQLV